MMRLYRIEKEIYRDVFPPMGSLHFDGRWHTAGMWVVYCSESIALAKLECLASATFLPDERILKVIELKDIQEIKTVDRNELPTNWNNIGRERNLGFITKEIMKEGFLGMKVPSVLSPLEHNFLLFPSHPRFKNL
ncbi:MAG: RES family NAD+ phosphorylase, partial [Bacteroidota bacterium]